MRHHGSPRNLRNAEVEAPMGRGFVLCAALAYIATLPRRRVSGFHSPTAAEPHPLQRHPISCASRASINHRVSRNSIVAFPQTRALGCCGHRDSRSPFVQKRPAWVWLRLSCPSRSGYLSICRFILIFIFIFIWLSVPVFCSRVLLFDLDLCSISLCLSISLLLLLRRFANQTHHSPSESQSLTCLLDSSTESYGH